MPDVDGRFLGETITPRRWDASRLINLILEDVPSPSVPVPGRLWRYPGDERAYFDDSVNFNLLAYSTDPVATHGNTSHSPTMLSYFLPILGPFYNSGDVTVTDAATTLVTTGSMGADRWNIPFMGINFRSNVVQQVTMDVWIEVDGTQRTAKFPVGVEKDAPKRPFLYTIASRNIFDLGFWQAKFTSNQTIALMGQVQEAGKTCIVSDRYVMIIQVE